MPGEWIFHRFVSDNRLRSEFASEIDDREGSCYVVAELRERRYSENKLTDLARYSVTILGRDIVFVDSPGERLVNGI